MKKIRMNNNSLILQGGKGRPMPEPQSMLASALSRQYTIETEKQIGRYTIDIYLEDLNIAIEVDGGSHRSTKIKLRDQNRDKWLLENHGILTLRVTNDAIKKDIYKVISTLMEDIIATIQFINAFDSTIDCIKEGKYNDFSR